MHSRSTRQHGFTLLELLIVLVVMMVVTVAAFPTISKNLQVIRLQNSAQNVASILQRTRILAVRNNSFYSVVFNTAANNGQEACLDTNYDGSCGAGEPVVQLSSNVSLVTNGTGPSTAQITCGPLTTPCPAGFTGLNYFAQPSTVLDSYNARGLPCVGNPATTQPNPTTNQVCNEFDAASKPVGFLYLLQYTGSNGNTYAAVTVTPSGLVTVWLNSGTSWSQQ